MAKTRRRVRKSVARSMRVRTRTRSHMRGKAKTRKTKRRSRKSRRKSTRVRRHRKLKGGATAAKSDGAGQTQEATYGDLELGKDDAGAVTYLYTITLPEESFVPRKRVVIIYTIEGGEGWYETVLAPEARIFRAYFTGVISTFRVTRILINCENDRDCKGKYTCVHGACVEINEYDLSNDERASKRAASAPAAAAAAAIYAGEERAPTVCRRWHNCFKKK